MAFLGTALLSGLNLSAAEKAFRPWWDNVEDHIVYTIVIIVRYFQLNLWLILHLCDLS